MEMEPQYTVSPAIDKLKPRYGSYNEQQQKTLIIILDFYKQFEVVFPVVPVHSHKCFCKTWVTIIIIKYFVHCFYIVIPKLSICLHNTVFKLYSVLEFSFSSVWYII